MSAGAPLSVSPDTLTAELQAITHALSPLAEVVDELRAIEQLLREATPKIPVYEIQTLQAGQWWQAAHNGYQHLRLLSAAAITVSADTDRGVFAFVLAAATVTEFYLPDKSKLTVTAGGTGPNGSQPILVIWDDIS